MEAFDDTLHWAVTIFLLVRQQLGRVDPIVTLPLWRCMRFGLLRVFGIGTELHHHHSVGRFPLSAFSFCCCRLPVPSIPTNVVLQRKNEEKWADKRLSDSSHTIDWRDDPPQEVRALAQNFPHNAQTAYFILCLLLASFTNNLKGPNPTTLFFLHLS